MAGEQGQHCRRQPEKRKSEIQMTKKIFSFRKEKATVCKKGIGTRLGRTTRQTRTDNEWIKLNYKTNFPGVFVNHMK